MNAPRTIKFRVIYGNLKVYFITLGVYLALYIGEIVNFLGKHEHPKGIEQDYLSQIVMFGFLLLIFLPWALSTMLSTFVISSEGVKEYKGYVWGLLRGKAHTAWSGFQSWDNSLFFLPGQREKIPQINLYYIGRGTIRVNKKTRRLYCDDKRLEWDEFSNNLAALLKDVKLPCKAPKSEQTKQNWVIYLSAGAGALILFLLMAFGVLTIIAQPVVFGGALSIVLILSALSWMRSGKRR